MAQLNLNTWWCSSIRPWIHCHLAAKSMQHFCGNTCKPNQTPKCSSGWCSPQKGLQAPQKTIELRVVPCGATILTVFLCFSQWIIINYGDSNMPSTKGATLYIKVTMGLQAWEWTSFKARWQPKDNWIRHTDASSRSNILQHLQNLATFCNFKEIL